MISLAAMQDKLALNLAGWLCVSVSGQELQAVVQEREEQLGQREEEVQHLEQHVASLMGLAPAEGSLRASSAGAQLLPAGYMQRMAELEVGQPPI